MRTKKVIEHLPFLSKIFGVFFIFIGLIALITPLTPGALLLIVIGLEFLGFEILFIEKVKQKFSRSKTKH